MRTACGQGSQELQAAQAPSYTHTHWALPSNPQESFSSGWGGCSPILHLKAKAKEAKDCKETSWLGILTPGFWARPVQLGQRQS